MVENYLSLLPQSRKRSAYRQEAAGKAGGKEFFIDKTPNIEYTIPRRLPAVGTGAGRRLLIICGYTEHAL
jgi:hypothetical protein